MKINLKKARALVKKIDGEISRLHAKVLESNSISVDFFTHGGDGAEDAIEPNITTDCEKTKTECIKNSSRLYDLIDLKFKLRDEVGRLNESTGINKLLTKKNLDLAKKSILSSHASKVKKLLEKVPSLREIKNTIAEPIKESSYGSSVKCCVVPVFAQADLDVMLSKLAKIDKRIEESEDEIVRLNLSSSVGLGEDDLELLASVNIHL